MIKDRDFFREIRAIAVPVTAQSVVMSLLLVTDQLMVGQLGTTAMATVGISSKLTGVSIFAAQHWGRGDRRRIVLRTWMFWLTCVRSSFLNGNRSYRRLA